MPITHETDVTDGVDTITAALWEEDHKATTILPYADDTYDLGSSSYRWRNVYSTSIPWRLESKQTVSAETYVEWVSLSVYDMWMIIWEGLYSSASAAQIRLRLNDDSGTNYYYRRIADSTWYTGSEDHLKISLLESTGNSSGILYISGPKAGSSNSHAVRFVGAPSSYTAFMLFNGEWRYNANVSKITIYASTGTMTGTFALYYLDW